MKITLMTLGALAALFGNTGCSSDEPVTRTETVTTTEEHIVRQPVTTTTEETHVIRQ